MARQRGLPSAADRVLDRLTQVDTPGTSDTDESLVTSDVGVLSGTEGSLGTSDDQGTSDTAGTRGTDDTRGASGNSGNRGVLKAEEKRSTLRDHVKLRRDLADEMRDAVWFLAEHGRPRVQLGELLDEAIEAWLSETKKRLNDGAGFPHKGRLR